MIKIISQLAKKQEEEKKKHTWAQNDMSGIVQACFDPGHVERV